MSEQVYMCKTCGALEQCVVSECHCTVGVPFAYQTMTLIDDALRADVLALCDQLMKGSVYDTGRQAKRISERLRGSDVSDT